VKNKKNKKRKGIKSKSQIKALWFSTSDFAKEKTKRKRREEKHG